MKQATREDYIKIGGHYGNLFRQIAIEKQRREEEDRKQMPNMFGYGIGTDANDM